MTLDSQKVGESLQQAGLSGSFTPEALASLIRFTEKMLEINENLNLTRWRQEDEIIRFHFLDSAYALPSLQKGSAAHPDPRHLDLGTGCGFPGAVIIAAFPHWQVTLMDSVAKKIYAMDECLKAAGWDSATTICDRAEVLGQNPATREAFDSLSCRAVDDFPVVLEYGLPLLKVGGYLVNWMTNEQLVSVDRSQKALETLGGKIQEIKEYSLPGTEHPRSLVIVEKMWKTPDLYPRPVGRPSKSPL